MSLGSWLLVLLVLGFAGGCAYNYFLLNKRGEEIVPGIGEADANTLAVGACCLRMRAFVVHSFLN